MAIWIETKRRDAGLTRKGLAEEVGITENGLYRIETGLSRPSVPVLYRIADYFGMTGLTDYLDPFMDAQPYPVKTPQDESLF